MESVHAQHQYSKTPEQIKKIRNDINLTYTWKIEKEMLFTKQRDYENGPKVKKILVKGNSKKQYANNTIRKIQEPDTNSIESKQEEKKTVIETFYTRVYSNTIEAGDDQIDSFLKP